MLSSCQKQALIVKTPEYQCNPIVQSIIKDFDEGVLRRPTYLTPQEWYDVVVCLKRR